MNYEEQVFRAVVLLNGNVWDDIHSYRFVYSMTMLRLAATDS